MVEEEVNQSSTSKFNYATSILQRVDLLQFKASDIYRTGDLEGWFFEWKNIMFQLRGRFDSEEKKYLNDVEKKINLFLFKPRNQKSELILTKLIEIYLDYIQTKIEEWGMGLVNKTDETVFA